MQLEGTLDKFPLRELIEIVVYSSVTGVLELRAGNDVAQMYFRDGRPYHATAADQVGVEAIATMFEEHEAPFRFVADRETAEATLWLDPWELIERGEEQSRRWLRVRARVGSVECIPILRIAPSAGQVQISEAVWPVLAAIDGQRTIREIAEHLNWVLLDICEALLTLLEPDLIELQPPGSLPQPPRAPLAPDAAARPAESTTAPAAPGFLERLLAEAQAKEQQRPDLTDDEPQDRKRYYRYVDDRR